MAAFAPKAHFAQTCACWGSRHLMTAPKLALNLHSAAVSSRACSCPHATTSFAARCSSQCGLPSTLNEFIWAVPGPLTAGHVLVSLFSAGKGYICTWRAAVFGALLHSRQPNQTHAALALYAWTCHCHWQSSGPDSYIWGCTASV